MSRFGGSRVTRCDPRQVYGAGLGAFVRCAIAVFGASLVAADADVLDLNLRALEDRRQDVEDLPPPRLGEHAARALRRPSQPSFGLRVGLGEEAAELSQVALERIAQAGQGEGAPVDGLPRQDERTLRPFQRPGISVASECAPQSLGQIREHPESTAPKFKGFGAPRITRMTLVCTVAQGARL